MSVIINASSTSGLVMTSDLSGTLSLQSNGVAVTVPAVAGTMMVSGNMPAFSAYIGSNQSLSGGAWTKVQANTKEFDTASAYDNATNYRFTPQVAGYYQINASVLQSSSSNRMLLGIYKNGTVNKYGNDSTTSVTIGMLSTLMYMNGSTDYIEFWVFSGGAVTLNSGNPNSYFQAVLARAA